MGDKIPLISEHVLQAAAKREDERHDSIDHKIGYIEHLLRNIKQGKTLVQEEGRNFLYDRLASLYEEADERTKTRKRESVNSLLTEGVDYYRGKGESGRASYLQEIIDTQTSSRHSHKPVSISQKITASILVGGLVFAMRAMTGNVVSSSLDVKGEIIGSLLTGILLVGVVLTVISRLTAKP